MSDKVEHKHCCMCHDEFVSDGSKIPAKQYFDESGEEIKHEHEICVVPHKGPIMLIYYGPGDNAQVEIEFDEEEDLVHWIKNKEITRGNQNKRYNYVGPHMTINEFNKRKFCMGRDSCSTPSDDNPEIKHKKQCTESALKRDYNNTCKKCFE